MFNILKVDWKAVPAPAAGRDTLTKPRQHCSLPLLLDSAVLLYKYQSWDEQALLIKNLLSFITSHHSFSLNRQ